MSELEHSKIEQIAAELNDPENILKSIVAAKQLEGQSNAVGQNKSTPRPCTPARDPIEAQLVRIWSELLGKEPIGVFDDFFELGGYSLQATQVLSQVREVFEVELSLAVLFEGELTIAEMAGHIRKLLSEDVRTQEIK
jgi:hypothetical protein